VPAFPSPGHQPTNPGTAGEQLAAEVLTAGRMRKTNNEMAQERVMYAHQVGRLFRKKALLGPIVIE